MIRILDTHLHLVYPDRFAYPWLQGAGGLNRAWSIERFRKEALPLGIDRALHMEVDVAEPDMEAETRFVLGLDPMVVGAIAAARPEHETFATHIERLAALPGLRGVRRILHQSEDGLSQTPLFAENLRRLAGHGLTFDLCVLARQHGVGEKLIRQCPDVQFVLDHCGVPDVVGRDYTIWRESLARIAELPNVACKVSGIIAYAGPNWVLADLKPYFEAVIDLFGWDRVVWGSDFPVCTQHASLTDWVKATHALLDGCSAEEKAKLLHKNAERVYRV